MLPDPLVPPDCDCTSIDSFSLNVERLMASELVALSSHEVVACALFLWARAWKQIPAASLPDDDKILASFAKIREKKFKKIRNQVLRGFVKCSDERLYHKVLAADALRAWTWKKRAETKRKADAERLRLWRETHRETGGETPDETSDETRFVASVTTILTSSSSSDTESENYLLPVRENEAGNGQDSKSKKAARNDYPEAFERFWRAYPTTPNMSKKTTFAVWKKLPADDRDLALRGIDGYRAFLAAHPKLETLHAERFVTQRRFDGFLDGSGANGSLAHDPELARLQAEQEELHRRLQREAGDAA
jgi:hypothetical protein